MADKDSDLTEDEMIEAVLRYDADSRPMRGIMFAWLLTAAVALLAYLIYSCAAEYSSLSAQPTQVTTQK